MKKISYINIILYISIAISSIFLFGIGDAQAANFCTTDVMREAGWNESEIPNAITICLFESGGTGDPTEFNYACLSGFGGDYSVGPFQMNLYVFDVATHTINNRCPGGFTYNTFDRCTIFDQAIVDACEFNYGLGSNSNDRAQVVKNATKARELWESAGGTSGGWCHWSTAASCYANLCGDLTHPIEQFCTGSGGGASQDPGSTPEIGDLKLEVNWPKVPGMDKTLNELVEGVGTISLNNLIKFIYGFSLWIGGIVAFFTLIYVGYMYIFSGANPGMRQYAKKRAIGVASGITILLLAVVILNTINPDLSRISTTIEGPNLELTDDDIAGRPKANYELTDDVPPPYIPPTTQITFTVNDKDSIFISPSQSVTLVWKTKEADRCEAWTNYPTSSIWDGVKNPPEGGSETIDKLPIEGKYRFSITCTRSTTAILTADVSITVSSGSSTGIQPTADIKLVLPTGEEIDGPYTFTDVEEELASKIKWSSTAADSCLLTAPANMGEANLDTAGDKWLELPFGNGVYVFGMTCINNSSGLSDLDSITITKAL